jgi:hypothetical protein
MPFQYDLWNSQWDTLYTTLSAHIHPGGKLAGIAQIRNVALPERNEFPYIGIEFDHDERQDFGSGVITVDTYFWITCGVIVPFDPTATSDPGETAFSNLRPFLNDGLGNGLSVILDGTPTMANSTRSRVVSLEMKLAQKAATGSGTIAWAIYKYMFRSEVQPLVL